MSFQDGLIAEANIIVGSVNATLFKSKIDGVMMVLFGVSMLLLLLQLVCFFGLEE